MNTSAFGVQRSMKAQHRDRDGKSNVSSHESDAKSLLIESAPKKYLWRQRAPALEREKFVSCQKGSFIREAR